MTTAASAHRGCRMVATPTTSVYVCKREFMLLSRRVLWTLSDASFGLFVLTVTTAAALSCAALLSQAVRSARHRSWSRNFNAFVIGAAYAIVVCLSRIPHTTVQTSSLLAHRVASTLCEPEARRAKQATTHHKGAPDDRTGRCSAGQQAS